MELLLLPILGLGGMYLINKDRTNEQFTSLPNVDIPDKNYPEEYPIVESEQTSQLSTQNRFDDPNVYTNKYVSPFSTNDDKSHRSMTGDMVSSSYFEHNNMVPFFGSKVHSNNASNPVDATLDNYNGSGSQYVLKKEQAPLFAPNQHTEWTYGMPSTTDYIQSHINASNKMTNVKPMESIQVGPGLGLGVNTLTSNDGFNNGMMAREQWTDKDVDSLRTTNNPKATGNGLLGYEGPAGSVVKKRGEVGIVEKNRVNTMFERRPEDNLPGGGIQSGHTMRSIPMLGNSTKPDTTTGYIGGAGYSNNAQQMEGEYFPSTKNEVSEYPIRPAFRKGGGGGNENDYGMKSNTIYQNNRSTNNQESYFGALVGSVRSVVAPVLDILRPSRKENTINVRPYQNAKSSIPSSYVYNSKDVIATTNREVTENSKFHLTMNGTQTGAYQTTAIMEHPKMVNSVEYAGNANGIQKPRTYDAEYNQRNNDIKSAVIDGRMIPGYQKVTNATINQTCNVDERLLQNNRPTDKQMPYQIPDTRSMGNVQDVFEPYSGQSLDRNDGSVLSQLKDNPFNRSILSS